MKRFLVASLIVFLAACATEDSQAMIVVQNQFVDRAMAMCNVPSIQTMNSSTDGILDVGLVQAGFDGYYLYPLVQNTLADTVMPSAGAHNDITINGANIELVPDATLAPSLPPASRKYFMPSFGGTIGPGDLAAMEIDALPRTAALQVAKGVPTAPTDYTRVVIRAQIVGTRSSDTLTSNWFEFPVRMCRFCLTGGPPQPCVPLKATDVKLGGCQPQMDTPVTCCTSQGKTLCGPSVPVQQ